MGTSGHIFGNEFEPDGRAIRLDKCVNALFSITVSDRLNTRYVKGGYAVSDEIVLATTPTTRTVFRPGLHSGGVRGDIVRQKIGTDGTWKDLNEVNFKTLAADCGVSMELDTSATQTLYEKLSQLYEVQKQGVASGTRRYVVAEAGKTLVIDDKDKLAVMQALLDQDYSEDFWRVLAKSNPDLATRLALAQIQLNREEAIKTFEVSLASHPDDEEYWENFFVAHPWMLESAFSAAVFFLRGETYLGGKMPVGRQGAGGVATDFLFADDSTKSFAVIEIKTPKAGLAGSQYRGKRGAIQPGYDNETYAMHSDLSGGVVQLRNQIGVAVEHFQSVLGPGYDHKLNRAHPKGVLVIGSLAALNDRQKDSFNHFRYALHSLTVITFDELLQRLKLMFGNGQPASTAPAPRGELETEDLPF